MFSNELLAFLQEPVDTLYGKSANFVKEGFVRLYLRNTWVYELNKPPMSALVIAVISIEPDFQNQKLGSSLIETIHTFHTKEVTKFECVHNPILQNYLVHNNWVLVDELNHHYYKYKHTDISLEG